MSILKVSYGDLSSARKSAIKAANELDKYASGMNGVARKISNISGGQNSRTSSALLETQQKIAELGRKRDTLTQYANKIERFENDVKNTDMAVAKRIKSLSASFAGDKGFNIGGVSAFFKELFVKEVNSTSVGRWVDNLFNKAKNKVNEWKDSIKHWFKTGGGKYIKKILLSVVAIGVAVFTVITAATGILEVLGAIGGVIAVFNAITSISFNAKAYKKNEDDPAWAARYGKINKVSDYLRFNGYDKAAAALDIVEDVTSVATAITGIRSAGTKFRDSLGDKGFTSIKALFGNKNTESVGKIGSKFMVRSGDTWNFTTKSIYTGLKSIFTDSNFRSSIGESGKLFKDEFISMYKYTKMNVKQSGYVMKDLVKGDSTQRVRSMKILWDFTKSTIKGTWGKVKKDVWPDFKKIDEKIERAQILGREIKFSSQAGMKFKALIIKLNQIDAINKSGQKVYDVGKSIYDRKVYDINISKPFTPNISKIKENIKKILKDIEDSKVKWSKLSLN